MGLFEKIIGDGIGAAVEKVGGVVDRFVTTDAEREAAKLELTRELNRAAETAAAAAAAAEQALLADVASARAREVQLAQAGQKNYDQKGLAYIAVLGFFILVFYLVANGLDTMNSEAAYIIGSLTGLVGAIAKDVYGYHFGSSRGSREKDLLLNRQPPTRP